MNILIIKNVGGKSCSTLIENESYVSISYGVKKILKTIFNVTNDNLDKNLIVDAGTKYIRFHAFGSSFEISTFII